MKIIHTSDWHLGHRLYRYDRTDEEAYFFERLAEVVGSERPDALLVSGDVFHTGVPGNDVAKKFTEQLMAVQDACPPMEIVITAGNHDSYSRLEVDQALWSRHHVHIVGTPAEKEDGVADFGRNLIRIGEKGIIAAIPFCHARNFPVVPGVEEPDRFKAYFRGLRLAVEKANPAGLPAVLMAHLAVGGDTDISGQDGDSVDGSEQRAELTALGAGYDYIALGHIHCAQWIKGAKRLARYCGTPRPIHFDEHHVHGVDVVEVCAGAEPDVRTVPFAPLRALKTVGGAGGMTFEDAVKALATEDIRKDAYVRLNVALGQDEPVGAEWTETARKAAEERGLRFCLINPIRDVAECDGGVVPKTALTMDQIRDLSNDDLLKVLNDRHELSGRQRQLLSELLRQIGDEERL